MRKALKFMSIIVLVVTLFVMAGCTPPEEIGIALTEEQQEELVEIFEEAKKVASVTMEGTCSVKIAVVTISDALKITSKMEGDKVYVQCTISDKLLSYVGNNDFQNGYEFYAEIVEGGFNLYNKTDTGWKKDSYSENSDVDKIKANCVSFGNLNPKYFVYKANSNKFSIDDIDNSGVEDAFNEVISSYLTDAIGIDNAVITKMQKFDVALNETQIASVEVKYGATIKTSETTSLSCTLTYSYKYSGYGTTKVTLPTVE